MLWRNCFLAPLNWNQLSTEACLTNSNSSQSFISLKPGSAVFVHRQLRLLKTSNGTGLDGILPCLLNGCDYKHLSSPNGHNKSLDFFCSFAGGMEKEHFIKMGIRSVWITTIPSPLYRWLRRSLN